jgi:hypothetical protein
MKPIDMIRLYWRKNATLPPLPKAMELFHVDNPAVVTTLYDNRARHGLLQRVRGGYTVSEHLSSIPLSQWVRVEGEVMM